MRFGTSIRWIVVLFIAASAETADGQKHEALRSLVQGRAHSDSFLVRLGSVLRDLELDWPVKNAIRCGQEYVQVRASPNNDWFLLFIAASDRDGVGGHARYCLVDSMGETRWLCKNWIAAPPCLSDRGRVALFSWKGEMGQPPAQLRIEVVEPDGRTAWDSSLSLSSNHRPAVHPAVFSSDASKLFVVTWLEESNSDIPRRSRLHCIEPGAGLRWRASLGDMIPSRIHDHEFETRVLVHDIGNWSTMKPNQIIVMGPGDRTIAQHFEPNVVSGSHHFDADSGQFYFADRRTNLCRIDLRTGKREENLPVDRLESTSLLDSVSIQRLRQLVSGASYKEREVEPPVWVVDIRGPRVRTLRNEFLDQTSHHRFIWSRIPIRLPGGRILAKVAWLEIGEDGTPRSATLALEMGGILDAREEHILRCGSRPGEPARLDGVVRPDVECTDAYSFAITSRGILWSNARTIAASPPREVPPLLDEAEPLHSLVEGGGWIAGIGPLDRISVLDPAGNRVLQHVLGWEPYLFPSGRVMHISREHGSVALATDGSRKSTLEGVPTGRRCYSTDGRRMLILESKLHVAHLYDVSDPFAPILLGSLQASRIGARYLGGGALSSDGRRVVVTIIHESGPLKSHVVCDERMNVVTIPLSQTILDQARFLSDEHLLIGESWGTESAYEKPWHYTKELRIYKLSAN